MGTLRNDDGDGDGNENGKKKALALDHTELCTCITLVCTFLWRHGTTTTWRFLILRFMEDVNTRQRFSFPFSELRYSLLEFNSRKTLPTFSRRASSPIWASEASLVRGRGPSRLRRPLARSRETRFTRPNRRACAQATNIWRTERNGRSAIKIEAVRINFLSDVFVALGVFVAWAPY